jgi:hypothetical protein
MTRALLLLTTLCGGCLIVPATKTSRKTVETAYGTPTFVQAREATLTASRDDRTVTVSAKRIGDCTRDVFAVEEVTQKKRMRLGGAQDPRARVFGIVVAPVTLPISAFITSFVVAADGGGTTTREQKPIGTQRIACSVEANELPVTLTLPSGTVVRGVTDIEGTATLEIPDAEPYEGTIAINAPGAGPAQLAYSLQKPAITASRDAITECAAQHGVGGTIKATLAISYSGRITRLWLSAGSAQFNACVSQRLANVQFPAAMRGSTVSLPLELPATTAARL